MAPVLRNRGKVALKRDEHDRVWPTDFLEFVHRERIFATLLTPTGYGRDDYRWDTYRICEFSETLAFYGLPATVQHSQDSRQLGTCPAEKRTLVRRRRFTENLPTHYGRVPLYAPERPSTANGRHQQHLGA
jgi:hypothetical protein